MTSNSNILPDRLLACADECDKGGRVNSGVVHLLREAAAALSGREGREAVAPFAFMKANQNGEFIRCAGGDKYAFPVFTTPQPGDGVVVPRAVVADLCDWFNKYRGSIADPTPGQPNDAVKESYSLQNRLLAAYAAPSAKGVA